MLLMVAHYLMADAITTELPSHADQDDQDHGPEILMCSSQTLLDCWGLGGLGYVVKMHLDVS